MRTLSAFVAVIALFLTIASLLVLGGALFALVLFFPLFLLAFVTVLAGLDDRTVRQHNPAMDATGWRGGSDGGDAHSSVNRELHAATRPYELDRRTAA